MIILNKTNRDTVMTVNFPMPGSRQSKAVASGFRSSAIESKIDKRKWLELEIK